MICFLLSVPCAFLVTLFFFSSRRRPTRWTGDWSSDVCSSDLDGEHAPNDYTTFITQLQALKDSESAPIVRPQWFDPVVIKRLLDIGYFNFLIPFIETEEMAKNAVAATRYPPLGKRGIGTAHRSNKYGYMTDYFDRINDDICVTVQIESTRSI